MIIKRCLWLCAFLFIAPAVWAQTASEQTPHEEQNETMIDTLKRMQIKREENDHKKILEKGAQLKDEIDNLTKQTQGVRLPRESEKKLKEIEKFAKQIRSESGGSEDDPLESPPTTLDETLKRLSETSERLNNNLAKTSRRVVSIYVVNDATEIIQLVKLLRGYVK
jgi:hypothetical protein